MLFVVFPSKCGLLHSIPRIFPNGLDVNVLYDDQFHAILLGVTLMSLFNQSIENAIFFHVEFRIVFVLFLSRVAFSCSYSVDLCTYSFFCCFDSVK